MFHHAVENRTLLTLDWSQNWRYRHETQLPDGINKNPTVQNVSAPGLRPAAPTQDLFTIVTRNDKVRWDTDGIFGRQQVGLFNNRLLLFAGARHDQVTYNFNFGNQYSTTNGAIKTPGAFEHFVNSAWTLAGGSNFKLTHNIALYGNYSQSFQPTAQAQKLGDQPLGNTRASGVDYGVKCNFFNDRLQFTVGGYYVNENGLKVTLTENNIADVVPAGSQNSKGVESDFTFKVTDSLNLLGGYGWVNARLSKEGDNVNADGRRPPDVPVENGSLAVKYNVRSGILKGFSTHAGLVYVGVSYPETTNSNVIESGIRVPAYYTVHVGVDYGWEQEILGTKLSHSVGLSVDNALNRFYVSPKLTAQPGRGIYVTYTLKH